MATNFGTRLTTTRPPWMIIALCLHLSPTFGPGYAMVSCKFFPEDPCCHGNQPFLFKDKNWLQAYKSVKRWNAAARLYSVAMGQIPRSTERISGFVTILIPQHFTGRTIIRAWTEWDVRPNCQFFSWVAYLIQDGSWMLMVSDTVDGRIKKTDLQ